jgi:hypothetical protein
MPEELFEKSEVPPKVEKKQKKKVSQATLDALARGREKMRLKREAEKKIKDEKKEEVKKEKEKVKLEIKTIKEGEMKDVKQKKTYRKTKKQLLKEQQALECVLKKEKQKEKDAKIAMFHDAKCRMLEKCASVAVYQQLNTALDELDDETICNDDTLKDKLQGLMETFKRQDDYEVKTALGKHTGKISTSNVNERSQDLSSKD